MRSLRSLYFLPLQLSSSVRSHRELSDTSRMQTKLVVGSVIAILLFDLGASLASRSFGFPYARASIGSFLIYFAIGFATARTAAANPIRTAATVAMITGVAEASLGWAISWYVGPGRLSSATPMTVERWIRTAVLVAGIAAGIGALGGLAGRTTLSINSHAT